MGPAGFKTGLDMRPLIVPFNDTVPGYRILSAWGNPASCRMVSVSSNRILKRSSHPFDTSIYFGRIYTCDGTFLDHSVEKRFCDGMLRNENNPFRPFIKTMDMFCIRSVIFIYMCHDSIHE